MKIKKLKLSSLPLLLWVLYIIAFPFFIFPPGSLQIADFILIIGITLIFRHLPNEVKNNGFVKYSFLFILYSTVINIIFSLIYIDFSFIKSSLYYIYAFLVILYSSALSKKENFYKVTFTAMILSIVIQILLLPINLQGDAYRGIMFFNNPNQLGEWAICCIIIILSLIERVNSKSKKIMIVFAILICSVFIIYSISQAAIISLLILLFYFLFIKYRFFTIITIVILLVAVLMIPRIYESINDALIVKNAVERIENDDDDDNDAHGRGYDRIYKNPEYLLFGAGEGKLERFDALFVGMEIHSTLGNILFSYGIIGLLLYMGSVILIIKKANTKIMVLLLVIFTFTLVHMTLRWPFFWITLFFIYKNSVFTYNQKLLNKDNKIK